MCMPPSWLTIGFFQVSMFELKGRAALVTGGNGGIGLGMAQGLAAAGATLAIAGRDEKKNAAAAKELGGRAISIKVDLRRSEEHTSELQSQSNLVCRLLLEKKKRI